MSLPDVVSREAWIRARVSLLEQEKAVTRARDDLAAERRRLPMVEVTEDYDFTAADGSTWTLLDLFEGRRQLIVDHYMFDPEWEDGCMSCAGRVDQYGNTAHLHERETTIAVVSRAPIEKLERWKHKMGWDFPWYSSFGSRFNFDYGVSFDDTVEAPGYNYRSAAEWEAQGMPAPQGELHGTSVFLRDGDRVYHTLRKRGARTVSETSARERAESAVRAFWRSSSRCHTRGFGGVSTSRRAIDDYAFLSDCHSAVLIDRAGSVDWWCVPRFDSPSIFGRLLGPDAGHFALRPTADFEAKRQYVSDSLVLCTTFTTATAEATVTDALGFELGARGHDIGVRSPHVLLRRVEGIRGEMEMALEFAPRLEYGLTVPNVVRSLDGVLARGGPVSLAFCTSIELSAGKGGASGRFMVGAGETVDFRLAYTRSAEPSDDTEQLDPTIEDTIAGWQSWAQLHEGFEGRHRQEVRRSSMVLQGLTYQPTGAVVAAATTSLPEQIGAELNFDYRFAWLRDLSLTIRSLWIAACPDEAGRLFNWIADASGHLDGERVQIMYGVEGERVLSEHELDHLPGFRGSRPVRVGNAAWDQEQLDVLGEVLDAAEQMRQQLGDLDESTQRLLIALADRAAATWREPDAGMWEARDQLRQYVSSKVMCWVALDRATRLAPLLGDRADPQRWSQTREHVKNAVLAKAWSEQAGAYTGAFGSDDLDASVLLLPLVGFLDARDERMWTTIEAIERELGDIGLVRRWPDDPMGFLICTFWLVECLALGGELTRAEQWFATATSYANDLGLMAEEADPDRKELLGNFPQAFSHVGLINAAWRLTEAAQPSPPKDET